MSPIAQQFCCEIKLYANRTFLIPQDISFDQKSNTEEGHQWSLFQSRYDIRYHQS